MIPGLGDDRAAVAVTDEHHGASLLVDGTGHGIYVIGERAQGVLNGDDAQACGLQQRNDLAPRGRVDPGTVNDYDCRGVEVTRDFETLRATSTRRHFLPALLRALVDSNSRAALSISAATAAGCET
jgi:hypothetical protein